MYNEAVKRIKPVRESPIQAFVTDKFQLFDTIETILKEVGPCQMIITSFSMSEEFIRKIYRFKEAGRILGATVVIDHKASAKVSKLLNFAGNILMPYIWVVITQKLSCFGTHIPRLLLSPHKT